MVFSFFLTNANECAKVSSCIIIYGDDNMFLNIDDVVLRKYGFNDEDIVLIKRLEDTLLTYKSYIGVNDNFNFSIGSYKDASFCIEKNENSYMLYLGDNGNRTNLRNFNNLEELILYLLEILYDKKGLVKEQIHYMFNSSQSDYDGFSKNEVEFLRTIKDYYLQMYMNFILVGVPSKIYAGNSPQDFVGINISNDGRDSNGKNIYTVAFKNLYNEASKAYYNSFYELGKYIVSLNYYLQDRANLPRTRFIYSDDYKNLIKNFEKSYSNIFNLEPVKGRGRKKW